MRVSLLSKRLSLLLELKAVPLLVRLFAVLSLSLLSGG